MMQSANRLTPCAIAFTTTSRVDLTVKRALPRALHGRNKPRTSGIGQRVPQWYARNDDAAVVPQTEVMRDVCIITPASEKIPISKTPFVIGCGSDVDLIVQGDNVLERHAEIYIGRNQVTIKALGGDPDNLLSESFTEMNEIPLRSQVSYLVCSGSKLRFGTSDDTWIVEFQEEAGINPLNKALIDNMVSTFSQEAREAFQDHSGL